MSMTSHEEDEATGRGRFRGGSKKLKVYEEMLIKDIPGMSRHNEPLQAVVENQLGEEELNEENNTVLERNRALLQYVATIANSNNHSDEFNYEFIESLVRGGADINVTDHYGQTIFHEVARSWNTDAAKFLLDLGCDINKQDSFGRTALHVAAAVDFPDITQFLLGNNANIDARTFVEDQAPIHYAAKNGAVRSLKVILGFQADINSKDRKQRTALQLAAEWSRADTAKLLLDEGAASCLLDACGNSALCILIDQLPNIALEGLDQLHATDVITLREYYYLQYLEKGQLGSSVRTPLEVAVATRKYEVVTHPVMQRLIHNKWVHFGRFSTMMDIIFYVIYGIIWTAGSIGIPNTGKDVLHEPRIRQNIFLAFIIVMTLYDIATQVKMTIKDRKSQSDWVAWRTKQLEEDQKCCHPRWPQEQQYVTTELKRVKSLGRISSHDAWFYIEWIILLLLVANAVVYTLFAVLDNDTTRYLFPRLVSILNLLVWLRLLRYVRPFPGIGTLVIILAETSSDFFNWVFLYLLLLLPFTAAFWINFGGLSPHPVKDYDTVRGLLYSVFRIAMGDDFNFEGLHKADPVMSRILLVLYITTVTIVTLNLLIALLTDTFSRVHSNAVANTVMQRAMKVVDAEKRLSKKAREKYNEHMKTNCFPEIIKIIGIEENTDRADKTIGNEIHEHVSTISRTLLARFGTSYGKARVTDFDLISQDIKKIKTQQEQIADDLMEISKMLKFYADNYDKIKRRQRDIFAMTDANESEKDSKSFMTALQGIASSLIQRLVANRKDEEEKKRRRKKRSKDNTEEESGDRSKERRRRRRKKESEEKTSSRKKRNRKKRSRESKRTKESTAASLDAQVVILPAESQYQSHDVDQWDNVSVDI